jgi:twitching motility protein PilT
VAHIDRYIEVMTQQPESILVFNAGEKVTLTVGQARHCLSPTEASVGQLSALFKPIMPPNVAAEFEAGNSLDFHYGSPHGPVHVSIRRQGAQALAGYIKALAPPAAPPPAPVAAHAEIPLRSATMAQIPSQAAPAVRAATAADIPAVSPAAVASAAPGRPAINALLAAMLDMGASDLHLTSGTTPVIRKDGDIIPLGEGWPTFTAETLQQHLREIMPQRNREQFEADNDTDFGHELAGRARFRVNVFRDRHGVGSVMRQIPTQIRTVEELRIPKAVVDLCTLRKGLVLVTGPCGSGKSTTLAALVDHMNRNRADHVITIEDPIEFVHAHKKCLINQREVFNHTRSFAAALKAALREDPNIVLVGELRDLETVSMAIETASTGHMVLSTLHTNTASSTVDRIIDQFPDEQRSQVRLMLADSLKGVVSQTLCKKQTGGRVMAMEILIVTSSISNLIREGKTFQIPSMMQTNRRIGCQLLNDTLLELVKTRQIHPEEALDKSPDRKDLAASLTRMGFAGTWTRMED